MSSIGTLFLQPASDAVQGLVRKVLGPPAIPAREVDHQPFADLDVALPC